MDEKAAAMQSRLAERHAERQARLEQRRQDETQQSDPAENVAVFEATLKQEVEAVQSRLAELKPTDDRTTITAALDGLGAQIAALHKFVADSAHFLPSFDLRRAEDRLKALQAQVDQQRETLLPKKKFAFRPRAADAVAASAAAATAVPSSATAPSMSSAAPAPAAAPASNQLVFQDRNSDSILLSREECSGQDIALSRLTNCKIYIPGSPDALHVTNLVDCMLCIGPVRRSLLLHNCQGCQFVLACQQLRIHNTTNCDFYIHVTSRAIIENCNQVRFAPYTYHYPELDSDFAESGLDRAVNNWDQVNDFLWIRPNQASPHWSVLPEAERKTEW